MTTPEYERVGIDGIQFFATFHSIRVGSLFTKRAMVEISFYAGDPTNLQLIHLDTFNPATVMRRNRFADVVYLSLRFTRWETTRDVILTELFELRPWIITTRADWRRTIETRKIARRIDGGHDE